METSNSYCSLFWNHISIRPGNRLQPCCRFETATEQLEIFDEKISDTLNSSFFTELRKNALQGIKNPGCRKCYELEDLGLRSPRMKNNNNDKTYYTSNENNLANIKVLDLFVGDTCNLKCIMCNPTLSTSWRIDFQKLGWELPPRSEHSIENLQASLLLFQDLQEVRFIGGEPLLMKQHEAALQALSHKAPKIKLTYSTNATVLPDTKILDHWQNFKEVSVHISVDGVGKTNDYIRFPSKWDQIDSNIDQFIRLSESLPHLKIDFLCTVSLFNIWDIQNLETWYLEKCRSYPIQNSVNLYLNPLVHPEFMSLNNLNEKERIKARSFLNDKSKLQIKMIRWLEGTKPIKKKAELRNYIENIDGVRNIQVQDYIPEAAELFS